MQICPAAVNKFEAVTDFAPRTCLLEQTFYSSRLIKSDNVAFGVRENLSGRRVRELNTQQSTVHGQK